MTHGISDFRGVEPGGEALRVFTVTRAPRVFLGGICEMSASQGRPITEDGANYAFSLGVPARFGLTLKNALRDGALGQHLLGLLMQAEDAPQISNRVDLDPTVGGRVRASRCRASPTATTPYEMEARKFYAPVMRQVVANAGAPERLPRALRPDARRRPDLAARAGHAAHGQRSRDVRHRPDGRFHDVDNLYACDGSVFVTSSGYNPTLTLIAVSLKIAHGIAKTAPGAPGC